MSARAGLAQAVKLTRHTLSRSSSSSYSRHFRPRDFHNLPGSQSSFSSSSSSSSSDDPKPFEWVKADSTADKPSRPLWPSPRQKHRDNDPKARHEAFDPSKSQTSTQSQTSTGASAAAKGKLVQASFPSKIHFTFENGQHHAPPLWLRDCCPCSRCVSESSGQKNFATVDIPVVPDVESITRHADGSLVIVWANDFMDGQSHTSTYSPEQLQLMFHPEGVLFVTRRLWDRAIFEQDVDERHIQYDDWMAGGEHMATALKNLAVWGLIVVKGVPHSHRAVKDIANQIGPLQSTFYGDTWDVVSKPDAENVAYTNGDLCLHQDLMYVHDTPKIQLLHCMNNESLGGDSLFSDGLRAAAEMQHKHYDTYHALTNFQVNYHYNKNGNYYSRRRSVILHPQNRRKWTLADNVAWSPPFQAPFDLKTTDAMPIWHEAAKIFKDSLQTPANMLQFRLQPGDCVIFDNRRILHGRTNFDGAVGLRHLRGAYVSGETTTSAMHRVTKEGLASILTMGPVEAAKIEFKQAQEMFGVVEGGAPQYVATDVGSRGGAAVGAPGNTAVEAHPSETPRGVVAESAVAGGKVAVPMRLVLH